MTRCGRIRLTYSCCVAAAVLAAGCFDPDRVVEFQVYPSPVFGHVDLGRDLTDSESFTVDADDAKRVLSHANWYPIPAGCKGCWLATMKLDNGHEYRVRLDRFRYWFMVENHVGCYVFVDATWKREFRKITSEASNWIHRNECRWSTEGRSLSTSTPHP